MFKIYRLKIRGVEPFHDHGEFTFGPFFTLIRGENGAGKTTVLESLALLGHCSVMDYSDHLSQYHYDDGYNCYVKYTVVLGTCFFDGDGEVGELAKVWKRLLGNRPYLEINVRIFHVINTPRKDLKADLKDESVLRETWKIAGKKEEVDFLKRLVVFSRPEQVSSEEEQRELLIKETLQRYKVSVMSGDLEEAAKEIIFAAGSAKSIFAPPGRSDYLETGTHLPPFICYFNTDMYHYGLGLDIRESPKHLAEELSRLVKDRLHIIDEFGVIKNFDLIKEFWSITYEGDRKEDLDLIWFDDEGKAYIVITDENKNTREFLSSGENQTLSLGLVFGALRPSHSIIMLDEPDLHLSLPAALRMYNEVFKRTLSDHIQVISVSHLPFIFPQALYEEWEITDVDSFNKFYLRVKKQVEHVNDNQEATLLEGVDLPRCLTLFYLNKRAGYSNTSIDIKKQKDAAEEAGRYQNDEIDSILSQSKNDPPTIKSICKDVLRLWRK